MFTVKVDGSNLELLIDTGGKQLTHVRKGPGDWLTATRFLDQDTTEQSLCLSLELRSAGRHGNELHEPTAPADGRDPPRFFAL